MTSEETKELIFSFWNGKWVALATIALIRSLKRIAFLIEGAKYNDKEFFEYNMISKSDLTTIGKYISKEDLKN